MLRFLIPALLVAATSAAAFDPYNLPNLAKSRIREMAEFHVALERCPAAKPGPRAKMFWQYVRDEYRHVPHRWAADEPFLKDLVRSEIVKARDNPRAADDCEHLKRYYGSALDPRNNAILMKDGSDTTAKCKLDGSCSAANTITIDFY